jgi:hypothetical protein
LAREAAAARCPCSQTSRPRFRRLPQLSGHLKLLGACLRRPLTLLLANCDAALAVEGGAGLAELARKLLSALPRATVVISSSADARRALLEGCGGGGAALLPRPGERHDLPGGGALEAHLFRVARASPWARGGAY